MVATSGGLRRYVAPAPAGDGPGGVPAEMVAPERGGGGASVARPAPPVQLPASTARATSGLPLMLAAAKHRPLVERTAPYHPSLETIMLTRVGPVDGVRASTTWMPKTLPSR